MERTFPVCEASVGEITEYFSKRIREYKVSGKLRIEYELLMEELITKLIAVADPRGQITLRMKKRLGTISAKIRCPGKPVVLESESGSDYSGQIINEYSEALRQSYAFGVNEIVFTTSFSSDEMLLKNLVCLSAALLLGVLFRLFCSPLRLDWITGNITLPVVMIFVRCMQMVAVPVAFFSLAVFVVNIRSSFDADNKTVRLSIHYLLSSVVAIAAGVLVWVLLRRFSPSGTLTAYRIPEDNFIGNSLKSFLSQVVSANIVEPFLLSNPIPFLINGLLTGLAASSVFGKNGESIRKGLSAINDLFSRMMNLIYGTIPFFLFFAVFDLVIKARPHMLRLIGFELLCIFLAILLMLVIYLFRLIIGRVSVVSFFREYARLLFDNLKIASNIDSYPYNKRILARKMSLSREYLSEGLKLGILLNMDGNCLVVSAAFMGLVSAVGVEISPMKYLGILIILLLFSVGAPNLPGSFLLGMIILMSFAGISGELVGVVLIFEALISKFYSFLNAAGDIITLAIEDERLRRKSAARLPEA